jgi:NAD(P)-dependent dehydrogenase (short-subunit alcohol dehydrogenase family)
VTHVAVISGATRGLGLALAAELRAHGFAVAGCGTSAAGVRAAGEALGADVPLRVVDVADAAAVGSWADDVVATLGAPDLVIANAGVVNSPAPIWDLSPAVFERALAVNVGGVANMMRAFLPAMIARGSGTFVATSSGWGRRGKEGLSPYCASKFAVEGLVQSVALEVPAPLRVVSLDPGNGVRTAMLDTCLPDELDVAYPAPAEWAAQAVDYILAEVLHAPSGSALTVPLAEMVA